VTFLAPLSALYGGTKVNIVIMEVWTPMEVLPQVEK